MFTACPHCDFLVTHLSGQPRPEACPRCGKPLAADPGASAASGPAVAGAAAPPALATLLDDEPAPPAATAPEAASAAADPAPGPEPIPQPQPESRSTPQPPPAIAADAPSVVALHATPAQAPAAPRTNAARPRRARWQWPLVVLLALLLGLQVLLADRARLAADPQWRPLLLQACGVLRCSLPDWREPGAFTMVERSVRPGQAPGTLRVDATFRNDARWAQPWPLLQLSLADADGRTTGSGVFAPEQYLGEAPEGLLAPGQSAQVTFVVQEPAPGTVAFSFRFH